MRTLRPLLLALVAAPLVATLTGCVVVPAHRYHGYDRGYGDGGGYGAGYSDGGPVVTGSPLAMSKALKEARSSPSKMCLGTM